MSRRHVQRWVGVDVPQIGRHKIGTVSVDQCKADVSIHRNKPGTRELREPYPLTMDEGITVLPDDLPIAPRLPILRLRTILRNKLRLIIDGDRAAVTLKKGWL